MPETTQTEIPDERDGSPSVQRVARLLRHIAEGDPVTNVSNTARTLRINRATLLRLLQTLAAERFIEPHPSGSGWRIGIGLIGLTAQAFFSEDLVQTSAPILTRIAETLGLSIHLGVLDGTDVIYLVRRTPNHVFASNIRVGSRLPAHAANIGRIILANMPAASVDRLYAGIVLRAVTSRTAVTLSQLHAQLEVDLAAGLAWSDGNYEVGISSVAAAIFDMTGAPVAALNASGHSTEFAGAKRRAQIAAELKGAAAEISERLGWHNSAGSQRTTQAAPPAARRVPAVS